MDSPQELAKQIGKIECPVNLKTIGVDTVMVSQGIMLYEGVNFSGLQSKVHIVKEDSDLLEIKKLIFAELDEEEQKLIKIKQKEQEKVTVVRRQLPEEISKLCGIETMYRGIIVTPAQENMLAYGFESIIIK